MHDDRMGFFTEVWESVRPFAVARAVDTSQYILWWLSAVVAHLFRSFMAIIHIEPVLISFVQVIETWFFISSFAAFFAGLFIDLGRTFWSKIRE